MVRSKFIGKVYDGYEVVHCYEKKRYSYEKDNGKRKHTAYNFVLVNYLNQNTLVLSGDCLGRIDRNETSVNAILNSGAKGSRNPYINKYIQSQKLVKGEQ